MAGEGTGERVHIAKVAEMSKADWLPYILVRNMLLVTECRVDFLQGLKARDGFKALLHSGQSTHDVPHPFPSPDTHRHLSTYLSSATSPKTECFPSNESIFSPSVIRN